MQARRSSGLELLPSELLCDIACRLHTRADLKSLRIVCRTTKIIAERYLFRGIRLQDHPYNLLSALLRSEDLAAQVRELQVKYWPRHQDLRLSQSKDPLKPVLIETAAKKGMPLPELLPTGYLLPRAWLLGVLLTTCVNLRRLEVQVGSRYFEFSFWSKESPAFMHRPMLPQLKYVTLSDPDSLQPLRDLLVTAPNIFSLETYRWSGFGAGYEQLPTIVDYREDNNYFMPVELRRSILGIFPNLQRYSCHRGGGPERIADLCPFKDQLIYLNINYSRKIDSDEGFVVRDYPDYHAADHQYRGFASLSGFSKLKRLDLSVRSPLQNEVRQEDERFFDLLLPPSIEEVRLRHDQALKNLVPHLARLASQARRRTPHLRKVFLAQLSHSDRKHLELHTTVLRRVFDKHYIDFQVTFFPLMEIGPLDGAPLWRVEAEHKENCPQTYVSEMVKDGVLCCGCIE
jgi:hypothetical protein